MPTKKPSRRAFNYEPASDKHAAFHEAWKSPVRILVGGYGASKSHAAAAEILRHLLENPLFRGQKALVVGLTTTHNRDLLLPEFKKILTYERNGRNIGYVEGVDYFVSFSPTMKITLPFGGEIIFKSLEAGTNLAGFNVAIAFADEIDKVDLETWNEVQNRVRTVEGGFTIGTCNGSNQSHWLWERYLKYHNEHGVAEEGVFVQYVSMYDNKFLPKDARDRYERQYGYSELEKKRALLGHFVSLEGCVFSMFDRERHTRPREHIEIGENWEVNAGLDFGFNDPTACLWVARTPDDRFIVFREHYITGKTVSFHADAIKSRTAKVPPPRRIFSDHYSETVQTYREYGVNLTLADKGKGSIFQGIAIISQLLHDDRLIITRNCVNLIRELETYQFGKNNEPKDKDNHAIDALRYVLTQMEGKPGVHVYAPPRNVTIDQMIQTQTTVLQQHDTMKRERKRFIGKDRHGKPQYITY